MHSFVASCRTELEEISELQESRGEQGRLRKSSPTPDLLLLLRSLHPTKQTKAPQKLQAVIPTLSHLPKAILLPKIH